MTESYYLGSSCRGSIRSCDFQSSNNSAASPVSARNALLSASSINALVTDRDLFTMAASVVPKIRAVVDNRKDSTRRSSLWQSAPSDRLQPPCWVVKKKQHDAEISEFDRAKLRLTKSVDGPNWFRGTMRATDTRHSMIEPHGSLYIRDAFMEHTRSEVRARELVQWPLNDVNVSYAVSAQVTLSCRLDEAMTMLFSRESLQFDASMKALFGARKYRSGDLLVSREFRKSLRALDFGDDNASCWEDEDLNDFSQSGWIALQSVVLRSRRSLNPMAAAKHTSRRQRLCFAAYSQHCPATNEAFYTMKTLPKPMHDKFTRRRDEHTTEQALRGELDHIAAGYHLTGSYSDLSGHQTRIVMTAYVSNPPAPTTSNAPRTRARFWGKEPSASAVFASSGRRHAPSTANSEAKYVVNLLAAATTSFEQLVRRRRLGSQPFLHMPMSHDTTQSSRCSVCLKNFGLLRPQRFCQLCAQRVCRECSRKFDVEPVARRVRRSRICFACVANVDASVFQQDNPLLNTSLNGMSTATAGIGSNEDERRREDTEDAVGAKITTAFYDILLRPSDNARSSQPAGAEEEVSRAQNAFEAQMHRLDRSSSAATASASFSSTPGRQLADALFSGNPLLRARALEIVRQVVKQVTTDSSAPTSSTSTSSSTSTFKSSTPVFQPQYPDRSIMDRYFEARLQLSSISLSCDPAVDNTCNIPRKRSSSLYNHEDATQRRRRSTSGQCSASSTRSDLNTRLTNIPRPWATTTMETELDLDDDVDSGALDSICEVAAMRMRCSVAYITAINGAHSTQTQRVVGSFGASHPSTQAKLCPFSLVANGKPFVIKDPMRDPHLGPLGLVGVRFFAGFPIKSPNGSVVACLCTADSNSREKISLDDLKAMHALSKLASDLFEEEVNPYTPRRMTHR